MKKIFIAVVLTMVSAVPGYAQMSEMPMHGHGGGDGHMMGMGAMEKMDDMTGACMAHAESLGLTDDQLAKLKPIHNDMQKKQARYRADVKIAEIELMEVMDVKDFDLEKAAATTRKIGEIKTAHHLGMLQTMKEVRTMLTDDQFKKMKKMMPMHKAETKPAKRTMKKQK